MTTVLFLMVLILIDGTEDRHLMRSHQCIQDRASLREIMRNIPPGSKMVTEAWVQIIGFQCRPWKMEAMG